MGRICTPGLRASINRNEMPCCFRPVASVLTRQNSQSAKCPSVIQILLPFTTYSSPCDTARVLSDARSDPDCGSEKPCPQKISQRRGGGRNRRCCSVEPNLQITGP